MTDLSEDADATEALRNAANLEQRMLLVETQTANLKHHHGANASDDEQ